MANKKELADFRQAYNIAKTISGYGDEQVMKYMKEGGDSSIVTHVLKGAKKSERIVTMCRNFIFDVDPRIARRYPGNSYLLADKVSEPA